MGQLKVRFTIEHQNVLSSFESISELKYLSFSESVLLQLSNLQNQLIRAAADTWLQQKFGKDSRIHFQVTTVQEDPTPEIITMTPKA